MTTEQNKALMRRFLDCSIASDPAEMLSLLSPDYLAHIPTGPADREGFVKHNAVFNSAFNDKQIIVEDLVAENDRVIARILWRGTQTGEFMGLPPTGRTVDIQAVITERIKDGKLVEHWSLFDRLGMMQQLGLVPGGQPAR